MCALKTWKRTGWDKMARESRAQLEGFSRRTTAWYRVSSAAKFRRSYSWYLLCKPTLGNPAGVRHTRSMGLPPVDAPPGGTIESYYAVDCIRSAAWHPCPAIRRRLRGRLSRLCPATTAQLGLNTGPASQMPARYSVLVAPQFTAPVSPSSSGLSTISCESVAGCQKQGVRTNCLISGVTKVYSRGTAGGLCVWCIHGITTRTDPCALSNRDPLSPHVM